MPPGSGSFRVPLAGPQGKPSGWRCHRFSSHGIVELVHCLNLLFYRANALPRGVKRYMSGPQSHPALGLRLPFVRSTDVTVHPALETKCAWLPPLGLWVGEGTVEVDENHGSITRDGPIYWGRRFRSREFYSSAAWRFRSKDPIGCGALVA